MDFAQLSNFIALARYRQFSEAAESEHISPSSLSKQIKAMEDEVGAKLFLRGAKGAELTEAGRVFHTFAQTAVASKQNMLMEIAAHIDSKNRSSTVVVMPVMNSFGIIDLISGFRKDFPHFRLNITEKGTMDIAHQLDGKSITMALIGTGLADAGKYHEHILFVDPFHVAVAVAHPLAQYREIDLISLAKEPLILLEDSVGINNIIYKACRGEGFEPNVAYTCKVVPSALSMVRQGFGVLMFTEQELRTYKPDGVELVRLRGNICGKLVLAVSKSYCLNQADKAFVSFTLKRYGKAG